MGKLLEFETRKDITELSEELHDIVERLVTNSKQYPKTFQFIKKLDEKL